MSDFMGWQMNTKLPLSESIQQALEYYEKKFGRVPNVVECSQDIQPLPVLSGVAFTPIRIPKNILLVGETNENSKMGLEVEAEL